MKTISRRSAIMSIATLGGFALAGNLWLPKAQAGIRRRASVPVKKQVLSTPSGPTTFTDNFTRANANPMSDPTTGGTWTSGPGAFNDCQISSNSLRSSVAGLGAGCRVLTPAFSANHAAYITLGSSTYLTFCGACVRVVSTTDCSCYIVWVDDITHLLVMKVDSAASGTAVGAAINAGKTLGAGDIIGLSVSGTSTVTLTVYLNGNSLATRTDSTAPYQTGQPGAYFYLNNSDRYITLFSATDI
jgi:hypothetical protein